MTYKERKEKEKKQKKEKKKKEVGKDKINSDHLNLNTNKSKCSYFMFSFNWAKPHLAPSFLLITVQRIQIRHADCLKQFIICVGMAGIVAAVSTHSVHFICRKPHKRAQAQSTWI